MPQRLVNMNVDHNLSKLSSQILYLSKELLVAARKIISYASYFREGEKHVH